MLKYHRNLDKAYEDLFKFNKDITILSCKCVDVNHEVDSNNYISTSLSNLKLTFETINKVTKVNKKK